MVGWVSSTWQKMSWTLRIRWPWLKRLNPWVEFKLVCNKAVHAMLKACSNALFWQDRWIEGNGKGGT
jgi:hypothetical protein